MRKTRMGIAAAVVAVLASVMISCTRNNGDIGMWFGTWHVETVTVDGEVMDNYPDSVFFQFQNSVFCLRRIYPNHLYHAMFGKWSELDDNHIKIEFPDTALRPLPVLLLDSVNTFSVERQSSHRVLLRTEGAASGKVRTFQIKRQP